MQCTRADEATVTTSVIVSGGSNQAAPENRRTLVRGLAQLAASFLDFIITCFFAGFDLPSLCIWRD
jgi:hypothetical protein